MVVRLPRIEAWAEDVDALQYWLPRFAPLLPLSIPVVLAKGEPAQDYPWDWSICQWLEGEEATIERIADPFQAAAVLAQFVTALQGVDPTGGPPSGRGPSLSTKDPQIRMSLDALDGLIDTRAATAACDVDSGVMLLNSRPSGGLLRTRRPGQTDRVSHQRRVTNSLQSYHCTA